MIEAFTNWLLSLFKSVFVGAWDFVADAFISLVDMVLSALAAVITAIPAPAFLTQYSLNSILGQMPSDVLFFIGSLKLTECFAVIGAGFAFRMLRKIFTLGQW